MDPRPLPDDQRVRALYDEYHPLVLRSLRRYGVRESDLLDVAQKVLITVHFRLPYFEGRSQVATWLVGICRRQASDYRRSLAIRREISTDPAQLDLARIDSEECVSVMWRQQSTEMVRDAIEKLSEPQKAVLVMSDLDETPGDHIAECLDISVGTVRSRLRIARERVRREVHRRLARDARYD